MTVNHDEIYNLVSNNFSSEIADNLFAYALSEYNYQPIELYKDLPDFFQKLETLLYPDVEYDYPTIRNMLDDSFTDYYLSRRTRTY